MARYLWNKGNRKFEDKVGRALKDKTLREYVAAYQAKAGEQLKPIAEKYMRGEINFSEMVIQRREVIKQLHGAVSVVANGGRQQMTPKTWARLGSKLKSEYEYDRKFMDSIRDKDPKSLGDQFIRQSMQYADGINMTYEEMVRYREKDAGMTEYMRTIESGNPCPLCEGDAGVWKPISGDLSLHAGDQCSFEYRNGAEAA